MRMLIHQRGKRTLTPLDKYEFYLKICPKCNDSFLCKGTCQDTIRIGMQSCFCPECGDRIETISCRKIKNDPSYRKWLNENKSMEKE